MYNYGYEHSCYPMAPVGGYAAPSCGIGNSFTLIVVLFILLIIIGCSYTYTC
ncbi:YjcZ family sporulation protein [Metabacillus iocasae]|uniref:Uncharacterized protein (TIGR01732 family) n=1 Tax=Priestia iocasae TaxID=2291674 RepID=A0ABS2QW16_9BACI|nr:YjcZ family sporulation protein [Metabacillus iocasae]MBM7703192.1 uncharacterized protein (TIGR01732 family) [Metabacillus iocasae]